MAVKMRLNGHRNGLRNSYNFDSDSCPAQTEWTSTPPPLMNQLRSVV